MKEFSFMLSNRRDKELLEPGRVFLPAPDRYFHPPQTGILTYPKQVFLLTPNKHSYSPKMSSSTRFEKTPLISLIIRLPCDSLFAGRGKRYGLPHSICLTFYCLSPLKKTRALLYWFAL